MMQQSQMFPFYVDFRNQSKNTKIMPLKGFLGAVSCIVNVSTTAKTTDLIFFNTIANMVPEFW